MADPREGCCRVVGCAQPPDDAALTEMQLAALCMLHTRVGNKLGPGSECRFCRDHRSSAAELLGALCAEVPAPQNSAEFRIGRIEQIEVATSTREDEAPTTDASSFAERFSAEAVLFSVRWYDGESAEWLEGLPPPIGAATSTLELVDVQRGLELYAGLQAYYENCAANRVWRIRSDVHELTRRASRNTASLGSFILEYLYKHKGSTLARLGILAFQALVVAVSAVCLWSIWISVEESDVHRSASLSAGAVSVLATTISMLEIISHLQNVHSPELQLFVVRILLIVPIFAVTCWLSLRFANTAPQFALYCNLVRDFYEAFVIHTFFSFLTACFGDTLDGSTHLCCVLASKKQQEHLFGLRYLLRAPKMGEPFFRFCKFGTLQFVWVKTGLAILELVLHSTLNHVKPLAFSPRQGFLYITIGINASQMVALYSLLLFYHTLHVDLGPIRPLGKFLSVKAIVFFTFWQSVCIGVLVHTGLIHDTKMWGVKHISGALNNYLLCWEMLLASVLHTIVFSHQDFLGPQLVHEVRRVRRFDSMMLDVVSPSRLVMDTREMLCHCFCCFRAAKPASEAEAQLRAEQRQLGTLRSDGRRPATSGSDSSRRGSLIARAATIGHMPNTPAPADEATQGLLLLGRPFSQRSRAASDVKFADPMSGRPYEDARTGESPHSTSGRSSAVDLPALAISMPTSPVARAGSPSPKRPTADQFVAGQLM